MPSPQRLLALDLSTSSGFAHGKVGSKPVSGVIRLPDPNRRGRRYNTLEGMVRQLISANSIEHVLIERTFISPYGKKLKDGSESEQQMTFSIGQTALAFGYLAAVSMAVEKEGLGEAVTEVSPASWRSRAGIGRAPKYIPKGKTRAWLKAEAMRRCAELGFTPRNDDEADALLIWVYGETLFSQGDANERLPLFNLVKI